MEMVVDLSPSGAVSLSSRDILANCDTNRFPMEGMVAICDKIRTVILSQLNIKMPLLTFLLKM